MIKSFIEVSKTDWIFNGLKECEMTLIEAINTNQIFMLKIIIVMITIIVCNLVPQ